MDKKQYITMLTTRYGYRTKDGAENEDLVFITTPYGEWIQKVVNFNDPVGARTGWGLVTVTNPLNNIKASGCSPDTPWDGKDILIEYGNYVLMIAEGTGENLFPEDTKEGYVDYFNLEVYDRDDYCTHKFPDWNCIGGGFMMRKKLIREEFYGRKISDVIDTVFAFNGGEDLFDLYATSTPAYTIISIG